MNKLGLGTVQFGCNYGISNANGQVPPDEVSRIIDFAGSSGITYIDTASTYGNSEEVLGHFDLSNFKIITKTIKTHKDLDLYANIKLFKTALEESKRKLSKNKMYGLLFHDANDLLSSYGKNLWELATDFKQEEGLSKIGVSVYNPEELKQIISLYPIEIVQLPLNIFDQRFVPLLKDLKRQGIEIHTRSAFLQGLLLMEPEKVNEYFSSIVPILKSIPEPKIAYALNFIKNLPEIDRIIVGCTSLQEIQEIVNMYFTNVGEIEYSKFKVDDVRMINPSLWEIK